MIAFENIENHENLEIQFDNKENQENHIISKEIRSS